MNEVRMHGDHAATCLCCKHVEFESEGGYGYDCGCNASLVCRCYKRHFYYDDFTDFGIQHELVRRGMGCSDFEPIDIEPSFDVVQRAYHQNSRDQMAEYTVLHEEEVCIAEWSPQRIFNPVILDAGVALVKEYCRGLGITCPQVLVHCYGTRYRISIRPGDIATLRHWDWEGDKWQQVVLDWELLRD